MAAPKTAPIAANQNAEQLARNAIDAQLTAAGWTVQSRAQLNFPAAPAIAVRKYPTDVGPADYVLFLNQQPIGVVEAKPEDFGHKLTNVEAQAEGYAAAKLKWFPNNKPLPFVYEATGTVTRFTDLRDPKPRSREVFSFARPETLAEWLSQPKSLRARLHDIPALNPEGLRDCQITAIQNLETSFQADRPRALVQMATGAGKTFTAITAVYRLLKFAHAKRILFLVDTRNLGEQAEQEFMTYVPNDDNRKFTELYNVRRLNAPFVPPSSQVCISTIQRMYSILKDEPLDESLEQENPNERKFTAKDPLHVVYNLKTQADPFHLLDEQSPRLDEASRHKTQEDY